MTDGSPQKPGRLNPGDTIGVVAPASHFNPDKFERGVAVIESMGFRLHVPDELFLRNGYLAGPDRRRAESVNRMFGDPRIHGIICARGGFGSMRILPYLDVDAIRRNPKIFMGFSDISALLSVLVSRCGMVAFHGPTVTTLGGSDEETRKSFYSAICGEGLREIRPEAPAVLFPGRANGTVAGGNLTTLCHLVGTPFSPIFDEKILFLEDRNEAPYRIDRMLAQMSMAGCFRGVKGVALGSFDGCGSEDEIHRIFYQAFQGMDIPIVAGFGIGHGRRNIVIPFGVDADLESDAPLLRIFRPATIARGGS